MTLVKTVELPFNSGDEVWHISRNARITLGAAFLTGSLISYNYEMTTKDGTIHGTVSEKDIKAVPRQDKPLESGEKLLVNCVPWTVIRDAFPGLPGGKGVMARAIVSEREGERGFFLSPDDFVKRMTLRSTSVDWLEISTQLDYGLPALK
jgi:hypothetical protein